MMDFWGSSHPDHAVGGEGEGVAGDGGLRWFPRQSGAVRLDVDGLQIPRRVHVCKSSTVAVGSARGRAVSAA